MNNFFFFGEIYDSSETSEEIVFFLFFFFLFLFLFFLFFFFALRTFTNSQCLFTCAFDQQHARAHTETCDATNALSCACLCYSCTGARTVRGVA